MRLWSLHPALLDRQGLTACWREALALYDETGSAEAVQVRRLLAPLSAA